MGDFDIFWSCVLSSNPILTNGFIGIGKEELREGAVFGYECGTFIINVQVYLPW